MRKFLRNRRKNNNKLNKIQVMIVIMLLIMTTFAWFTYSEILGSNVKVHINSWDIQFSEGSTIYDDNEIEISIENLYPGMDEETKSIKITNNGESGANLDYEIKEITVLGTAYTVDDTTLTRQDIGGGKQQSSFSFGTVVPFSITVINDTEVAPKTGNTPGESYLDIKLSWREGTTSEEHKEDTKWGNEVADFMQENPDQSPISLKLKINAIGKPRN